MNAVKPEKRDLAAQCVTELRRLASPEELRRIEGLLDIWSGRRKPKCLPLQQARLLFLPGLASTPWLEPSRFPFMPALSAAFPRIKRELDAYVRDGRPFRTYTTAVDDPFVRESWRTVMLCVWNRRQPVCRHFPFTSGFIELIRKHHRYIQQFGFISLGAGAELRTHVDPFNYLVSVHLCMTPTPKAGYTVAGRSVRAREGRSVAFDNSFPHAAWNRGDSQRIILAVHTLHPDLTPVEMEVLRQIHPVLARGQRPR